MALQLEQVAAALPAYDIGGELGRGSTGVVLTARHRQLGREVAVKLLTPGYAEDPELRSRFLAEARLLATLTGSCSPARRRPRLELVARRGV